MIDKRHSERKEAASRSLICTIQKRPFLCRVKLWRFGTCPIHEAVVEESYDCKIQEHKTKLDPGFWIHIQKCGRSHNHKADPTHPFTKVIRVTTHCPHPAISRGPLSVTQNGKFILHSNLGIFLCSTATKKSLLGKISHIFKVPRKTPYQETDNFQCVNVLVFWTHGE